MPRQKKERVKRTVKRAVGRARTPEEAQEVIEAITQELQTQVEEEVSGRVPGKTVHGVKTPWTYSDLCKVFPIVSFTPDETIGLTFNGVRVQAIQDIAMHVPRCFMDIYLAHKTGSRISAKSLPDSGFQTIVELGAGALPPE